MNDTDIAGLLGILKTLDPHNWVTIDDATIDVWHAALTDEPAIPLPAAMLVAKRLAATAERFPRPVEFRHAVIELVCGIPSAETARQQIERSLRTNYPGMPATYTPDDLVLEAAREIGGVYVFRVAQSEHETRDLWRRFTTRYDALRRERAEIVDIAAAWQALDAGGPRKAIAS